MPFDKFIIAPMGEGLVTDVRPWLIPDTAFSALNNAYVWRGRVRKRVGNRLMSGESYSQTNPQLNSRLRINIGTTDGAGNFAGNAPGFIFQVGQLFSVGTEIFTVVALGNPAAMLISGAATLATFDTTTGAVVINGAATTTAVYFYPAQPVMGFANPEAANINDERTIAWDTQFAYIYVNAGNGGWERIAGGGANALWSGTNAQFFWSTNYRGGLLNQTFLFTTNYNAAEPQGMRAVATTGIGAASVWQQFQPVILATTTILTARIIVPFQGRLLLLNTVERVGGVDTTYQNRLRYSRIPNPNAPIDPFNNLFWTSDNGTDNNVNDNLGTTEAIISVEFIKNRLIVFFERSTWELVFTGNEIDPFRWQQINTELGVESTFSVVPFDKIALGIGNTGVHACNGANVERIDSKIPNFVFNIHNDNDGVFRVHGIRDYFRELVYWTVPEEGDFSSTFPRQLLMYNYQNQTWALFNDSYTAFGYFQGTNDLAWNNTDETWSSTDWTWAGAFQQARFRRIVAGNQEGYTHIFDDSESAPGVQITNLVVNSTSSITITAINHNLQNNDFILITNAGGMTNVNNIVFEVFNATTNTFDITSFNATTYPFSGTYTGAGVITRVSPINITTKQYNFYTKEGRNAVVQKVDFLVDKTVRYENSTLPGNIQVNFFISTSADNQVEQAQPGALVGTSLLETFPYDLVPLEQSQNRLWHPLYLQANGEVVAMQLIQTRDLFLNPAYGAELANTDFQLHAFIIYARPDGRLQ